MMNYEEKYKEALETVQEILDSGSDSIKMSRLRLRLQSVFPELIKSEDERIKGAIIEHLRDNYLTEWALWLEKQDQKDPCEDCKHPMLNCHNFPCSKKQKYQGKSALEAIKVKKVDNTNKVEPPSFDKAQGTPIVSQSKEPKFKVGDWITNGEDTIQITIVDTKSGHSGYYRCFEGSHGFGWYVIDIESANKNYHLWTIKDAKDGDILVDVYGNIGIFQKNYDFDWMSYCSLGINGGFQNFEVEHESENAHPATKEQRELLFSKMKEAGYKWDDEHKELKKIETVNIPFSAKDSELMEATYFIPKGFHAEIVDNKVIIKKSEQKPALSEEDNTKLRQIEYACMKFFGGDCSHVDWLRKFTKPQTTWKPTEEQMQALNEAVGIVGLFTPRGSYLKSLSEQLKKLKEK